MSQVCGGLQSGVWSCDKNHSIQADIGTAPWLLQNLSRSFPLLIFLLRSKPRSLQSLWVVCFCNGKQHSTDSTCSCKIVRVGFFFSVGNDVNNRAWQSWHPYNLKMILAFSKLPLRCGRIPNISALLPKMLVYPNRQFYGTLNSTTKSLGNCVKCVLNFGDSIELPTAWFETADDAFFSVWAFFMLCSPHCSRYAWWVGVVFLFVRECCSLVLGLQNLTLPPCEADTLTSKQSVALSKAENVQIDYWHQ